MKKQIDKIIDDRTDHLSGECIVGIEQEELEIVKEELNTLFSLHVVGSQRELLIGFLDWQGQNKYNGDTDEEIVDWYLKNKDN